MSPHRLSSVNRSALVSSGMLAASRRIAHPHDCRAGGNVACSARQARSVTARRNPAFLWSPPGVARPVLPPGREDWRGRDARRSASVLVKQKPDCRNAMLFNHRTLLQSGDMAAFRFPSTHPHSGKSRSGTGVLGRRPVCSGGGARRLDVHGCGSASRSCRDRHAAARVECEPNRRWPVLDIAGR